MLSHIQTSDMHTVVDNCLIFCAAIARERKTDHCFKVYRSFIRLLSIQLLHSQNRAKNAEVQLNPPVGARYMLLREPVSLGQEATVNADGIYWSAKHETTQYTPAWLMPGRKSKVSPPSRSRYRSSMGTRR